ncbi:adenylate kinase [Streptomyces sp. NPDC059009]|uniref:adenylate kinase n=1 Tax=Streptomyces sp. NPDC059009 TaxID=3346694 RepID=UPI00369024BF
MVHVLNPAAALARRPDRVLVAGGSGAGKTTVAGKLGTLLGLPRIELDALYYRPGWEVSPEFAADVARATERRRWITEWHYPEVNSLLARRADLLLWLDYPARITLTSLALRTLLRSMHREVLWSGNQEPPLRSVFTDPDHILRHGWTARHTTRTELRRLTAEDPEERLHLLRFTRPADLSRWLIDLARTLDGSTRPDGSTPSDGPTSPDRCPPQQKQQRRQRSNHAL